MTESKYKVGDELAIDVSGIGRNRWCIYKITKISPTGRITLGDNKHTLEPNLRIRGASRWGPYHAEEVTDKIREDSRIADLLYLISTVNFKSLTLRQLEEITAIIKTEAPYDKT